MNVTYLQSWIFILYATIRQRHHSNAHNSGNITQYEAYLTQLGTAAESRKERQSSHEGQPTTAIAIAQTVNTDILVVENSQYKLQQRYQLLALKHCKTNTIIIE